MSEADFFPDAPVSIEAQVKCVERELGYRARVYSRRIGQGKMTKAQADREVALMEAVLETLKQVQRSGRT